MSASQAHVILQRAEIKPHRTEYWSSAFGNRPVLLPRRAEAFATVEHALATERFRAHCRRAAGVRSDARIRSDSQVILGARPGCCSAQKPN
jgi:hypothetical protein